MIGDHPDRRHLQPGPPGLVRGRARPAVEQSTNYDRLVIEIETDGSITPSEALSSAGGTLRGTSFDLVLGRWTTTTQGLELDEIIQPEAAGQEHLDLPIEDARPVRASAQLLASRAQVQTVGELHRRRAKRTCSTSPTSGRRSLEEVKAKLDYERGLTLGIETSRRSYHSIATAEVKTPAKAWTEKVLLESDSRVSMASPDDGEHSIIATLFCGFIRTVVDNLQASRRVL